MIIFHQQYRLVLGFEITNQNIRFAEYIIDDKYGSIETF